MKSKDHPVPEEFEDQPNLDDKDLVHELLNEHSWYLGYEDDGFVPTREDAVFVPTRKELLVLFKHWYKAYQGIDFLNGLCTSRYHFQILDDLWRRLNLIAKFLPEEVLEAVSKQMDEEELKLREKTRPQIAKEWGGKGDEFDKYF